ncbi:uncharacterized protein LAESUDRAFT_223164 [Laetiporus sulphureus 93-53]|uniref:Uncharacterized protein n=1 Tax=Laetiporus sulphureus 93-53 TaxID=1314785 RepID=A0A165DTT1_9APHY|nr:uncharacterized protein LAESUDRAFT_223164 [Laetiporus sulphureus 93-53]KZT05621.1 hypothetical protein LAESUDRAFT_223164 [Laetiporus sulphureus 93-53]
MDEKSGTTCSNTRIFMTMKRSERETNATVFLRFDWHRNEEIRYHVIFGGRGIKFRIALDSTQMGTRKKGFPAGRYHNCGL